MYEIVPASDADIERWKSDPLSPMYDPAVAAAAGRRRVAASAPITAAQPMQTPTQQAADDFDPQWLLGPRFRTPGMKPPPSGAFDLPPAAGSASDVQNAHKGCAAQEGWWK